MDIQSCVIYGGLLIICTMLAVSAQKRNCWKMLILITAAMTAVAGLRATAVGIDTAQYTEYFRLLKLGRFDLVYALEPAFMYLCAGLMKIFGDAHFLFAIFAALTHGLVLARLWDFKEDILLPWAVACYLIMFFPESMNVMRQMAAVAIVFYGTRYLSRKKNLIFLVFVGAASLFHNSALLGVGFLAFDLLQNWNFYDRSKKVRVLKAAAALILLVLAILAVLIFKFDLAERYAKYITNIQLNFGLMLYVKLAFFFLTIGLMRREQEWMWEGTEKIGRLQWVRLCYGTGILLTSLGYIVREANRIGWYFFIFESAYFGWIVKKGKYRWLFRICVAAILIYTFLIRLYRGSNGEIPYRFFWQI